MKIYFLTVASMKMAVFWDGDGHLQEIIIHLQFFFYI
jgi:hypothetical protein